MRLTVDLAPLLIRSAGVKNYLFHWYRALRKLAGDEVRGFPFLDDPGELRHESSTRGPGATAGGLAYLHLARKLPHPLMEWGARGGEIFHATNLVYEAPRGVLLSTTLHDVTSWLTPSVHTAANREADQRYLERILRRADLILAVSENTRQDAINVLKLDGTRIATVHSGVGDAFFAVTEDDAARARRRYGLERPYLLFVGTVEPRKNLDRLLDAWRGLRTEAELVVVGASGWAPESTLRKLESTEGVRRLGYVPEADLPGITKGAVALAYPSLYEGFGFPVAQAMACGTPVVTSNVSSLPEVAGTAAVLVNPLDTEELSSALQRVLEDGALRRQLVETGRERAKHYRWDRAAADSLRLFAALGR